MSYEGQTHNGKYYKSAVLQAGQFLTLDNIMTWIRPVVNGHRVQVKTVAGNINISGHALGLQTTALGAPSIYDTTVTNSTWVDLMPVNIYGLTGSTQRIIIRTNYQGLNQGVYAITANAGVLTGTGAFDKFGLTLERLA